jgi:hypothetical protein
VRVVMHESVIVYSHEQYLAKQLVEILSQCQLLKQMVLMSKFFENHNGLPSCNVKRFRPPTQILSSVERRRHGPRPT